MVVIPFGNFDNYAPDIINVIDNYMVIVMQTNVFNNITENEINVSPTSLSSCKKSLFSIKIILLILIVFFDKFVITQVFWIIVSVKLLFLLFEQITYL